MGVFSRQDSTTEKASVPDKAFLTSDDRESHSGIIDAASPGFGVEQAGHLHRAAENPGGQWQSDALPPPPPLARH